MNNGPNTYMGFEIHPLVFLRAKELTEQRSRADRGFDVAVRICRPGEISGSARSRVFHMPRKTAFSDTGDARREAELFGESVIDGRVPGHSVADL
jgi:hypothetical protein